MTSFKEAELQSWRLCILRCLDEADSKGMYVGLLEIATRAFMFHFSRDQLLTQLRWLEEQQCVQVIDHETPSGPVTMVKLRRHGHEVANGRATVPGIDKPSHLD